MIQNLLISQTWSEQAVSLFWRMKTDGLKHCLWAWLRHNRRRLLELDETLHDMDVQNSHYAGVMPVQIDRIKGSKGKSDTFDSGLHPIKETSRSRWFNIAREKILGHPLPPVELVGVNGTYYVGLGYHRISPAHSLGETFIDAEIIKMRKTHKLL